MFTRNDTRTIMVRDIPIGGGNPVTVQSMTNTDTRDVTATVNQMRSLASAGCDLVRVAVPNMKAAQISGLRLFAQVYYFLFHYDCGSYTSNSGCPGGSLAIPLKVSGAFGNRTSAAAVS